MTHINEGDLKLKAKQVFDQKADSLDLKTQKRLEMARETALSQRSKKTSVFDAVNIKWMTGAGAGLALVSLLTFMLIPGLMSSNGRQVDQSNIAFLEDIEILSHESELELYTQLDFYEWLDESLNEAEL